MKFKCNAMKSECYAIKNGGEKLNDMVYYAMKFEQTHLCLQKSF